MMEEDEMISFSSKITEGSGEIHPVAEILDNLKNDDLALRLGALKRLGTIALALGAERTTNDLIPFLASLAADEEDEVLLVLAEELPKLIEFGENGVASAHHLLNVLEILLQAEETVVRQQAISSCEEVIKALPFDTPQIESHLWPLWNRLAEASFFISKASAATLSSSVYARLSPPLKGQLRATFSTAICHDDCPIVRRAAAPSLSRLIQLTCADYQEGNNAGGLEEVLMNEFWPLFLGFASDSQDSVRLLAVEVALGFGDALSEEKIEGLVIPQVLKLAGDRSWRVRYMVAASFTGLVERVFSKKGHGQSLQSSSFDPVAIFTALLSDAEAEVRTAACRQLAETCARFPVSEFEAKILPMLRALASDGAQSVRAALAAQLNPLTATAGSELAATALFPLYTHFFADESSQVRLSAVSRMDIVAKVMGIERLSESLLPAIIQLSQDRQWRVREAVIEHLPTLSSHLGESFFDENLIKICMELLNDPVFAVRQAAILNLRALLQKFGFSWCEGRLISPAIAALSTSSNYLRRTGLARLLLTIIPEVPSDHVAAIVLPPLKALANDPVPNVRLSAARALHQLSPILASSNDASAILHALQQDSDEDVRYYVSKALQ